MEPPREDRPPGELDDEADREELRRRYDGLLQELRVLLPGSQVLAAFLFTVPFNDRFNAVDELGRRLYGLGLGAGVAAIAAFLAPTAFHRLGPRRSRSGRLRWSIRLTRVGLFFLAVSLLSCLALVGRFVYGPPATAVVVIAGAVLLASVWVVLPQVTMRVATDDGTDPGPGPVS